MKINNAYCLFEQSGTFKNELCKLGVHAEDFDILDDYGETDHIADVFGEIERAYSGEQSLFDQITADDIILAFFPCVRFEDQAVMLFNGSHYSQKNWTDVQRLEYALELHEELHRLYTVVCKLFIVCLRGGLRMIVENPKGSMHYLVRYFPVPAKVYDGDRREHGDYYKKPTQYWFVNCEPEDNLVMDVMDYVKVNNVECVKKIGEASRKVSRSLIHPQYARWFLKRYVVDDGRIQQAEKERRQA